MKALNIFPALIFSVNAFAWGVDGHGAIGILAVERLQPETRIELEGIIGSLNDQTILDACNWPDEVRKAGEWQWTGPFHYVNIPHGDFKYNQPRDCPEGQCVTEAIKNYAVVLATDQMDSEIRQQAFSWVCHLTGDLHQPLHAGYASDRGGNDFELQYGPEKMNLHTYWDFALIRSHSAGWQGLLNNLRAFPYLQADKGWSPVMVDEWTNESHQLVVKELYPVNPVVDKEYEQKSWAIMQERLNTAASRLALIIDTVLKPGATQGDKH